ncbi:hypothetical protein MKX03_003201, partial [Papaver bracteatum]
PGKEVKDALVYGWGSIQNEKGRHMAKIRSLLGLQDGSTSAPPLDDIRVTESALRGDDVSYENMKAAVEKCFGLHTLEGDGYVVHSFLFLLDSNDILQDVRTHLRSIIKSMSCTGLLRFANAVTGGSVLYEKSRPKMREIILEYFKKILQNPGHRNHKRFIEELPKLLKNPSNFEIKITGDEKVQVVDPAYLSPHSAADKILEVLKKEGKKKGMDCQEEEKKCMDCKPREGKRKSMDCHLLSAMIRRLKGDVKEPKFGDVLGKKYTKRSRLIIEVAKAFDEELCKVSAGEEFSIGLVKATSVALLGLNMSNPEIFVPAFGSDCPLKLVIHKDLLKCIRILSDNKLEDVKELRTVLDPISIRKVKPQKFQETIRKWLIEYLYEYPELELVEIPKPVKKTIDIIKDMDRQNAMVPKSPTICNKHKQANKELEIVGDLSAQFKQIMLDKNCDHNMDEDYNDAYCKDLEVKYDNLSKNEGNHSDESVGECEADGSVLPESTSGGNAFTLEYMGQDSSDGAGKEQKPVNEYLAIQEICDNRSLGAHDLIGLLLEKLLDEEGAELDGSKRSYLRGGRSDHQEDCAGTGRCEHQMIKEKKFNAPRRAPYK